MVKWAVEEEAKLKGDFEMLKKSSILTIVILVVCVGILLFTHSALQAQKGPTKVVGEGEVKVSESGYAVVLKGYNAYEKVKVVRAVADIKDIKASEALDLVDALPYIVLEGLTKEKAGEAAGKLKKAGCSVEVRRIS